MKKKIEKYSWLSWTRLWQKRLEQIINCDESESLYEGLNMETNLSLKPFSVVRYQSTQVWLSLYLLMSLWLGWNSQPYSLKATNWSGTRSSLRLIAPSSTTSTAPTRTSSSARSQPRPVWVKTSLSCSMHNLDSTLFFISRKSEMQLRL